MTDVWTTVADMLPEDVVAITDPAPDLGPGFRRTANGQVLYSAAWLGQEARSQLRPVAEVAGSSPEDEVVVVTLGGEELRRNPEGAEMLRRQRAALSARLLSPRPLGPAGSHAPSEAVITVGLTPEPLAFARRIVVDALSSSARAIQRLSDLTLDPTDRRILLDRHGEAERLRTLFEEDSW